MIINVSGACVCQVGYTYIVSGKCTKCPYNCATCDSAGVCETCNGLFRNNNPPTCTCADGYFEIVA